MLISTHDIIIIGGGHAGCEAALACARQGCNTALFTLSIDGIANMPCNPCIGGTAKGQIVSEIDALGGEMGKAADETMLQSRVLGKSKGAAVRSLRVQSDRRAYSARMRRALEHEAKLCVKQEEVAQIIVRDGAVKGVRTTFGEYGACAVVVATGTYLNSTIHVGEARLKSAADGVKPAQALTDSLHAAGVTTQRFKTGTPARVHRRSIDFARTEIQRGEGFITPFCFDNTRELHNKVDCYITYTNEKVHEVIRSNIHRSPLFSGKIEGRGPRYCPSIEDKVYRFADKDRHQLFIEPMGEDTEEFYLQGLSSSLPLDVQYEFLRLIPGLSNVLITRPAYAIEYDCINPAECLLATLEFRDISGLFGAGQFCGTSGYEEAAAQGVVAGINAVAKVKGRAPLILPRASSYIGTLLDDLVTKGCDEPYRMLTSRAEHRLSLRQDNAHFRLCEYGYEAGLLPLARYDIYKVQRSAFECELARLKETNAHPEDVNGFLLSPISAPVKCYELLKRAEVSYRDLFPNATLTREEIARVETEVKYAGYVDMQERAAASAQASENKRLPDGVDYTAVAGLRLEAAEKLNKFRPMTVGQAGRISGVNPADVAVLLVWLKKRGR